jgi:hypothetical protein
VTLPTQLPAVLQLPAVSMLHVPSGNGYTVTVAIPWAVPGVDPKPDLNLRGDVGFILSDPSGTINAARVSWSNKNTGLVMDQPGEAIITPQGFGDLLLAK